MILSSSSNMEAEEIMTQPFTGSPLMHPQATRIGAWIGQLKDQSDDFQQSISMLRTEFVPSKTPLPNEIVLTLEKNKIVRGTLVVESLSKTTHDQKLRFILTEWDANILRVQMVEIDREDNLRVEILENPADLNRAINTHTIS